MRFEFTEDTEGTAANNNGHVVHRLDLHVEGKTNANERFNNAFEGDEVGYISVTYIPSKTWRERYTGDWGLLRWGSDFHGWCGFLKPSRYEEKFYPFPKVVKSLAKQAMPHRDWITEDELEEMSDSELEERFEFYIEKLHDRYDEERERTRRFHVDKPRVEFIRVARSQQRQGYGTALYRRMTEELDRRFGFPLYASQLQRDCAEAAWEKLVTLDWNDAEEEEVPFEGDSSTRYKISMKPETKAVA